MSENPFIFGKPVKTEKFFNRKEEIRTAVGFLKRLQSFSIIGERRIGKTSFLEHILSREVLEIHGIDLERYIIINFSIGSLHEITKRAFIEAIIERIREQTGIEMESKNVFDKLNAYVEQVVSSGRKLTIALDEFELIAPILDDHFSHWLRDIFQRQYVMAITASQKTIFELEESGGKPSPLFNIFGNIFLGLFSRIETENMIEKMFKDGGMELRKEEISFLADLSGGNPYLIQLLGHHYYEEKYIGTEIAFEEFKESMLYNMKDQFEGYWKHLTKKEKKFLHHVESPNNHQISSTLETKGFIVKKNKKFEIFSPLFHEFVEMKAYRAQKKETLARMSMSILVSVLVLEIIGRNISSIQGFPEIFIKQPDMSDQLLSLMVFFIGCIILFYIFKEIERILDLKQIKDLRIFSGNKRFLYVFLVLVITPIFYIIGLGGVSWNLLGEAISFTIAYLLLKLSD